MIRTRLIAAVSIAVLPAVSLTIWQSAPAHADLADEWRVSAVAGEKARRQERPDYALEMWTRAYASAEKLGPDHPFYSISLRNLGLLYFWKDRNIDKAEPCFQKSVEVLSKLGTNYPDLVDDYWYLGRIAAMRGQLEKALNWFEKADQICKEQPPNDDMVPDLCAGFATIYSARGDKQKAASYEKKLYQSVASTSNKADAPALERIAQWLVLDARCGNQKSWHDACFVLAEDLYTKEIASLEKQALLQQELGFALKHRGDAYNEQGIYQDALPDFDRSIKLLTPIKEKADDVTAIMLAAASCEVQLNQPEEALSRLKKLALRPGVDSTRLVSLEANCYRALHKYAEELPLCIKLRGLSNSDLERLQYQIYQAECLQALGRKPEAVKELTEARIGCDRILNNAREMHYYFTLAKVYHSLNLDNEVCNCFRRARVLVRKSYDKRSLEYALALLNIGCELSNSMKMYVEARPFLEESIQSLDNQTEKHSPELATALGALAGLSLREGKLDESERLGKRALSLEEKLPDRARELLAIIAVLAETATRQGDLKSAQALSKRYEDIQRTLKKQQ